MQESFGNRLQRLMSGQSQQATVDMIERKTGTKYSQTTLSAWLRGTMPTAEGMIDVATAFGVSVDYMAALTNDRRPVETILSRLRELTSPPDVEGAAKLLAAMPEEERGLHIAQIRAAAAERQRNADNWRRLLRSVELAGMSIDEFEDNSSAQRRSRMSPRTLVLFVKRSSSWRDSS